LNLRRHGGLSIGGRDVPGSTIYEECFLMRSKQLLFCVTACACIAVAADASAETRRNTGKPTGTGAATTHAAPSALHANQQGMPRMRPNAGDLNFHAAEHAAETRTGNHNFAAEETMTRRTGNRIAVDRMTRRGYEGDRMYAGRDRFGGTRGFSENRTFISGDRVAERRGNRTYVATAYGGSTYGGYGRTWRGERLVGGGGAEVVAAGVNVGLSYYGPSAYYEYPGYGYNYGVGPGTEELYAYEPGYDQTPGYRAAAPLYNFAPGYVATVGHARGCRCSP
jgi:hypothetical protein